MRLVGTPALFGLYRNAAADPRDHVALFICRDFEPLADHRRPKGEIAEHATFPLDALPEGITRATRARIGEFLGGGPPATDW